MQEYTQEKVDHAEHMGIAIPADVKEQIFEYANLIGDSNTNEPKTTAQMFFTVYYAEKGDKMLHYFQGKIDIGTGNGSIISQLKMQNEMKLTDESWISYQQGKSTINLRSL